MTSSWGPDATRPTTNGIRLSVPGSPADVRVARLTAAVVAERLDFEMDEIDEVCVAVDELAAALIEARPLSEIDLSFTRSSDGFVAEGSAWVAMAPVLNEIANQVLEITVDAFELGECNGLAHFRATKRPARSRFDR